MAPARALCIVLVISSKVVPGRFPAGFTEYCEKLQIDRASVPLRQFDGLAFYGRVCEVAGRWGLHEARINAESSSNQEE